MHDYNKNIYIKNKSKHGHANNIQVAMKLCGTMISTFIAMYINTLSYKTKLSMSF